MMILDTASPARKNTCNRRVSASSKFGMETMLIVWSPTQMGASPVHLTTTSMIKNNVSTVTMGAYTSKGGFKAVKLHGNYPKMANVTSKVVTHMIIRVVLSASRAMKIRMAIARLSTARNLIRENV